MRSSNSTGMPYLALLPPHFPSYSIVSPLPEAHVPIHPGCREVTATHDGTFAFEGQGLEHRQLSPCQRSLLRLDDSLQDDSLQDDPLQALGEMDFMVPSSPGLPAFPIVPMATLDSACGESLNERDLVWIAWDFVGMDKILHAIKSKGPHGLNRYLSNEFHDDNSYQAVIDCVGMDILALWKVSSTYVCKHTFSSGD